MTNSSDTALLKVPAETQSDGKAKSTRKPASRSGQIIPRGKNYLVRIYLGRDENGKRKYSNKSIKTGRKNAEKYLTKALRDKDLGIFVEPTAETVSQFLTKWLATIAKPRVSQRTFEGYEWQIEQAKTVLGSIRLSALRSQDIQAFYASLSTSQARHVHAPLRSAFSQAVRWHLIHSNPCDAVELPRHQAKEMYAFSRDEAARFLAIEDKHRTLFAFLLLTGARPSEALALRWSDIDFTHATASIQRTLQWHKGKGAGWYFAETKTRRSRRSVPLPSGLVQQLKDHRIKQAEELLQLGVRSELCFTNEIGNPILLGNLAKRNLRRVLAKAKLPATVTLYSLRHSCASLLLQAGVHPKVVQERLGHASITLTLDTYSHIAPGMQESATEQLERMLYG
jgi:integrase